ncbi:hypothetical protein EDB81DRAFT_889255 [Dactylonectria macrodidyma]|uniref:Uncharacterized protein n=1 Tax=Dactylonectria macrodidyma TaxID=307937 RepID=A0A9P9INU5_9HYPO|nr:hypothetical protein EDB81DRAFT_889255 [Dactylonectria macrodidyma]
MSDKLVAELTKSLKQLSLSDDSAIPERWKDDDEEPESSIKRNIEDCANFERASGSPRTVCIRVVDDASGSRRLQPSTKASLQLMGTDKEHEVHEELITLHRKVVDRLPEHPVFHQVEGDERVEVEMIIVPKEEDYRDTRPRLPRPVDILTTDKPAADTAHYLAIGNEFVRRNWTDGKWVPGDLIGENGSDPATKAKSATYAESWDKVEDLRSATSTGHFMQHPRPTDVCLGWGGYDQYTHWQRSGRHIKKETVKKEKWSTDRMAPVNFVNESGEMVDTVLPALELEDLPPRLQDPIPLYELLHETDKRKLKTRRTAGNPAWAGTFQDAN